MKPRVERPFRLLDVMAIVAATAVAFAIFKKGISRGPTFVTFGGNLEQWVFLWMRQVVPFPAMWSIGLVALAVFDRSIPKSRKLRPAGVAGCFAAVIALSLTTVVASGFYALHALEELGLIPKLFTHPRGQHAMPPFADSPMEEIVGAAVLGAWSLMAASGRWRPQPTWIDRTGRALGAFWIALFLIYLYAYTG